MTDDDSRPAEPARVNQLDRVKSEYTQAAREILARSMRGVAKTKLTPDMLTLAGVTLCLAGAVLVGFEERNEKLFFWLGGALFVVGSVADILDGALARAASKGTVFGAFLDSTFDRLGEAAMVAAIGLAFMRDGNEIALVAAFAAVIGSFLVSYTRAKAEALGLRGDVGFGSRVERVVLISVGLGLAPVGLAPVADLRPGRDGLDHGSPADALRPSPAPRARRANAPNRTRHRMGRRVTPADREAETSLAKRPPPSHASSVPEVVGRDAELQTIERWLATPQPPILMLEGEAGIGKTTLWRAGVARARDRGVHVLSCAAVAVRSHDLVHGRPRPAR